MTRDIAALEAELTQTLHRAASAVVEAPDLFDRVRRSIDQRDELRRNRLVSGLTAGAVLAILVTAVFATSDYENGRLRMRWWILELITNLVLVGVAFVLGPLIKRFGKSYAGDVFRANPRTGKSFLALTDIAYYLIFLAYIMLTMSFRYASDWGVDVGAEQMRHEVARLAGILLIIGLLHTANIVMLPVIGRLLTMNRHLDEAGPTRPPVAGDGQTFVLRIEPAPGPDQ